MHLEHPKKLYHNFVDFKQASDRVEVASQVTVGLSWLPFYRYCGYKGLWRVLKEHNIDNRLIDVTKSLYDEATGSIEQQWEYDKDVHYNIILKKIAQKAATPVSPS